MPVQSWWRHADKGYLVRLNYSDAILKKTYEGRSRRGRVLIAADKHLFLQLSQAARRLVDDDDFSGCNTAEIVQRWMYALCGTDATINEIRHDMRRYHQKARGLKDIKTKHLTNYLAEPFQVTLCPSSVTSELDP